MTRECVTHHMCDCTAERLKDLEKRIEAISVGAERWEAAAKDASSRLHDCEVEVDELETDLRHQQIAIEELKRVDDAQLKALECRLGHLTSALENLRDHKDDHGPSYEEYAREFCKATLEIVVEIPAPKCQHKKMVEVDAIRFDRTCSLCGKEAIDANGRWCE